MTATPNHQRQSLEAGNESNKGSIVGRCLLWVLLRDETVVGEIELN
jgi:hypothetical protein